jgi:hypothetical protein
MDLIRVYTGEDGAAHFEEVDPLKSEEWSKGLAASHCSIREMAAGTVMDWHPAPRRQIVIHISGQLEIVLRDGTSHLFGPASARLMDDVTGSGHLTRVVGNEPVLQAVIHLADPP